jgi:uncharacterized protein
MSMFRPVTLITGASSGIGAALARVFAQHGHELAIVGRREPELSAVADGIAASGATRPHVVVADLARSDAPARIAHELLIRGVEPGIVVNNAGFGLLGPAAELDRGQQLMMIDLNVRAVTDLSLRWVDSARRHGGGILNVASVAAFLPGPYMAVYYATKAYVLSFTLSLHQELSPLGVRVTALCPGPVKTEFQQRAGMDHAQLPGVLARSAERVARDGYAGFVAGKRVVIPGGPNRILAALPRVLPHSLVAGWIERNQKIAPAKKPAGWPRRPSQGP